MPQSRPQCTPEQIRDARREADHGEAEGASILWGILRGDVDTATLAEASRDDVTTISRMSTGSDGVRQRLRTWIAAAKLSKAARARFLDLVCGALEAEWSEASPESASQGEAVRRAHAVMREAGLFVADAAAALDDSRIDAGEREQLRQRGAKVRHGLSLLDAELDALDGSGNVRGIPRHA